MTLAEFKAWFEGFTEDMDGAPTEKQWKRIKARVKDIDGTVTTYPVYIDRYMQPWRPYWDSTLAAKYEAGTKGIGTSTNGTAVPAFNSADALFASGKAEYSEMLAD